MTKPIPDKAEVALEYPDKLYIGTFGYSARFDAHLDEAGISLSLDRTGEPKERKSVRMHFHYALFAEILYELDQITQALGRGMSWSLEMSPQLFGWDCLAAPW